MTGVHPDLGELGPELRRLAQAVLDRLDPAVRAAALLAVRDGSGKCQQVWCPVCALMALVSGEEHPLLTIIAEHSVALFDVIRAVVAEPGSAPSPPDGPSGGGPDDPETPEAGPSRTSYQHIPVTVET